MKEQRCGALFLVVFDRCMCLPLIVDWLLFDASCLDCDPREYMSLGLLAYEKFMGILA